MSKYADIETVKEHILAVCVSSKFGHGLFTTTKALDLAIKDIPTIDVKEYADKEQAYMKGYAKGVIHGGISTIGTEEEYGLFGTKFTTVVKSPSGEIIGKWVVKENGNNECSVCGREKQDGWVNFCGFCGAKMKG